MEPRGECGGVPCSEPVPCPCLDRDPELPVSIEDKARLVNDGYDLEECYCVEFAAIIVDLMHENMELKLKIKTMEAEEVFDDLDTILAHIDKSVAAINKYTKQLRRIDNVGRNKIL